MLNEPMGDYDFGEASDRVGMAAGLDFVEDGAELTPPTRSYQRTISLIEVSSPLSTHAAAPNKIASARMARSKPAENMMTVVWAILGSSRMA